MPKHPLSYRKDNFYVIEDESQDYKICLETHKKKCKHRKCAQSYKHFVGVALLVTQVYWRYFL